MSSDSFAALGEVPVDGQAHEVTLAAYGDYRVIATTYAPGVTLLGGLPLDDVDDAVQCTTVNINTFTVPAGETFNLDLADGTTVNMSASPTPSPPSSPPRPLAPQAAWRRRPPIARLNGRLARLQWRCNYSRGGS